SPFPSPLAPTSPKRKRGDCWRRYFPSLALRACASPRWRFGLVLPLACASGLCFPSLALRACGGPGVEGPSLHLITEYQLLVAQVQLAVAQRRVRPDLPRRFSVRRFLRQLELANQAVPLWRGVEHGRRSLVGEDVEPAVGRQLAARLDLANPLL